MKIENLEDRVSGQGTMVIRAWTEPGHEHGFRARLTFSTDATSDASIVLATNEAEVIAAVQAWLTRLPQESDGDAAGWTAEASNGQP
jgi:hypothetical protein